MKQLPTILLIEDEIDILELLKQYLEMNHYKVLTAGTRNEAFFKINNQKFDCIISDISLRFNDVTPVLKELKTNSKGMNFGVPILIHSAHVTSKIINQFKDIIKAVHVKPTSTEIMISTMKKLITENKNTEFSVKQKF